MIDLAKSAAVQCMMPGFAESDQPAIGAPRHGDMVADAELHLAMPISALQRVRKTDPGSGDLAFIARVRGKRPASLAMDDRARVLMCAAKYRAQLPEGLRPPKGE